MRRTAILTINEVIKGMISAVKPKLLPKFTETIAPKANEEKVMIREMFVRFVRMYSDLDKFPNHMRAKSVPISVLMPVRCVVLI